MRILHLGWGFSPWRPGGLIAYAEDLMAAQVKGGHDVSYFLSGRHYPYVSGPRLKRWRRGGVVMHEVINSPLLAGLEHGTRNPDADLDEPRIEAAFRRVLDAVRPEVMHIQELHGLPSSVIDLAADAGVPTLMTLQDYGPLCTTLRLFDAGGRICMRREVGADCVARNANAPSDAHALIERTVVFEIARVRRLFRVSPDFDFSFLGPIIGPIRGKALRSTEARDGDHPVPAAPAESGADPRLAVAFQRRRDVNVERLGKIDRLVAQSGRVAEIYRTLGVRGDRMSTLPFTLGHISSLRPRSLSAPPAQITFATINGCASRSKGSEIVLSALQALSGAGLDGRFRMRVLGHVDPLVRDALGGFRSVTLDGPFDHARLDSLLDDVDVGIMPSMWEEALGYTGLELIAKGIPLVANPLGGIVEYAIEGETAWLNPTCSGEGLADVMARLIRDPAEVLRMHGRLMAVRDDLAIPMDRHVDAIEEIYRELSPATRSPRRTGRAAG